jgi:hypothetical protein
MKAGKERVGFVLVVLASLVFYFIGRWTADLIEAIVP